MIEYDLYREVVLGAKFAATGAAQHYAGDRLLPKPHALQIIQYPEDDGFYLFYLDAEGAEQDDTYHDSLEQALAQAEFEFLIRPDDWNVFTPPKRVSRPDPLTEEERRERKAMQARIDKALNSRSQPG
jgi:hypothetical protein